MQAVTLSETLLWSTAFSDVFALEYGFSVGFGGLFGTVTRTEAYPSQGGPNTRDGYAACVAPTAAQQPGSAQATDPFDPSVSPGSDVSTFCGQPIDQNPSGGYTDPDQKAGQQYGVRARTMLNGGHVPFFSARLAPQISLRIKPIHHVVMRIDFGFDFFSGVFLGGALAYGF
jgi:hypothetical protein